MNRLTFTAITFALGGDGRLISTSHRSTSIMQPRPDIVDRQRPTVAATPLGGTRTSTSSTLANKTSTIDVGVRNNELQPADGIVGRRLPSAVHRTTRSAPDDNRGEHPVAQRRRTTHVQRVGTIIATITATRRTTAGRATPGGDRNFGGTPGRPPMSPTSVRRHRDHAPRRRDPARHHRDGVGNAGTIELNDHGQLDDNIVGVRTRCESGIRSLGDATSATRRAIHLDGGTRNDTASGTRSAAEGIGIRLSNSTPAPLRPSSRVGGPERPRAVGATPNAHDRHDRTRSGIVTLVDTVQLAASDRRSLPLMAAAGGVEAAGIG